MRILLVADNCTDDTAAIGRALDIETIERRDAERHGKGFALAFGRDHLAAAPPEVTIVLDADCSIDACSLERLANAAMVRGSPVQALNLLEPDREAPAMVQVAAFAFAVKNQVRQLGIQRMGGAALLNGTGMAFPWADFSIAPLASGHLAEDLELGIKLARSGRYARLEPTARLFSKVSSADGTLSQRTRWERGFLSNARRHAFPTLASAFRRRSWKLILLAAHLLVPPLALLLTVALASLAGTMMLYLAGAALAPALTLSATMMLLVFAIASAWLGCGRPYLAGKTAVRLPLYLVWKMPIYASIIARKPARWVRTERS